MVNFTINFGKISAISANKFQVKFNKAVDTTKIAMDVKRETTPITVTTTYDDAKMVATLTGSSNFPEGNYSVSVTNDKTDLGTTKITVSQQKIAKIIITSDTVAVITNGTTQTGYATYKVEDQYGEDITTKALANNIQWTCGIGTATDDNKGIITIVPAGTLNLVGFPTISLVGVDNNTGISTSSVVKVSATIGTLSDIQLGELTNADKKVLTGGDTVTKFNITYTAKDASGNDTTNYELINNGIATINYPNNYINVTLGRDPSDSTKAVFEVRAAAGTDTLQVDMPISITVVTKTGKTSTITFTIKKPAMVDTFTLMAPSTDVATNETINVPYVAYDQNGNSVTSFTKLNNEVTLTGAKFVPNIDGTASIEFTAPNAKGSQVITAITKSCKYSTLTLNIQDAGIASSLTTDATAVIPLMQVNAEQCMDTGYYYGGFTAKDQYGRDIDLVGQSRYQIVPDANNSKTVVNATGSAYRNNCITLDAIAEGTTTLYFDLIDTNNANKILDTKAITLVVVKDSDIVDYSIDTVDPLYAGATAGSLTDKDGDYAGSVGIYGLTSSGAKVALASTNGGLNLVQDVYTDNFTNFILNKKTDYVGINACILPSTQATAKGTLTIVINGADGKVHVLSTALNSKNEALVASKLTVSAARWTDGISVNGDTITVDTNKISLNTMRMTRFDAAGNKAGRAPIYFRATDQFGGMGLNIAHIYTVENTTNGAISVDPATGVITADYAKLASSNSYIILKAVTSNGLTKTIKVVFTK
jgi:hypothetical protein